MGITGQMFAYTVPAGRGGMSRARLRTRHLILSDLQGVSVSFPLRISSVYARAARHVYGAAMVLAAAGACDRAPAEDPDALLAQDTTLARDLAMSNTPGGEGMTEAELAAIVQPSAEPDPAWAGVVAELERTPVRVSRSPARSASQTRPEPTPSTERGQSTRSRPDTGFVGDTAVLAAGDTASGDTTGASDERRVAVAPEPAGDRGSAGTGTARAMASRRVIGQTTAAACDSPALDDQRDCLVSLLAEADVDVNRNYRAAVEKLRREAGTRAGAPDPASVVELRTEQRRWLVYRDRECRERTVARQGDLWAPARAECLARFSTARARELSAV